MTELDLEAIKADRESLANRLQIKAGVMEMGERIAWGSDTSLMREAAAALIAQEAALKAADVMVTAILDGDLVSQVVAARAFRTARKDMS